MRLWIHWFLSLYLTRTCWTGTGRFVQVIAHIHDIEGSKAVTEHLRHSLEGCGMWRDEWAPWLRTVVGDHSQPPLGIRDVEWKHLASTSDVVIHNRAIVHWLKYCQGMLVANADSTLDALRLCNEGKPKVFTFISFTNVLGTDHYGVPSEKQTCLLRELCAKKAT